MSLNKKSNIYGLWLSRLMVATNVDDTIWNIGPSSLNNFTIGGKNSDLDKSVFYQIYLSRQEKDFAKITETISSASDFILTPGNILIATLKSDTDSRGGVTLKFDVAI